MTKTQLDIVTNNICCSYNAARDDNSRNILEYLMTSLASELFPTNRKFASRSEDRQKEYETFLHKCGHPRFQG